MAKVQWYVRKWYVKTCSSLTNRFFDTSNVDSSIIGEFLCLKVLCNQKLKTMLMCYVTCKKATLVDSLLVTCLSLFQRHKKHSFHEEHPKCRFSISPSFILPRKNFFMKLFSDSQSKKVVLHFIQATWYSWTLYLSIKQFEFRTNYWYM